MKTSSADGIMLAPSPYVRNGPVNAAYYSIITFSRATVKTDQEAALS